MKDGLHKKTTFSRLIVQCGCALFAVSHLVKVLVCAVANQTLKITALHAGWNFGERMNVLAASFGGSFTWSEPNRKMRVRVVGKRSTLAAYLTVAVCRRVWVWQQRWSWRSFTAVRKGGALTTGLLRPGVKFRLANANGATGNSSLQDSAYYLSYRQDKSWAVRLELSNVQVSLLNNA